MSGETTGDAMAVDVPSEELQAPLEEKLLLEVPGVSLEEEGSIIGSHGLLIITSRFVRWSTTTTAAASASPDTAREWDYPRILLHAISREAEKPNIYCQIAVGEPPGPDDDESEVHEIKLIPSNPDMLQAIWDALSEGAAMNPDPYQEERDPDAGEFFFNPDEVYAHDHHNGSEGENMEDEDDQ